MHGSRKDLLVQKMDIRRDTEEEYRESPLMRDTKTQKSIQADDKDVSKEGKIPSSQLAPTNQMHDLGKCLGGSVPLFPLL